MKNGDGRQDIWNIKLGVSRANMLGLQYPVAFIMEAL